MKNTNLFIQLIIMWAFIMFANSCKDDPVIAPELTVTDADGNIYKTVKIGDQIWMAENLKTTKYRNGDVIPEVTDNTEWCNLTTGAYCNYGNDTNNVKIYGRLYNWYTINDSRNLAPEGWHVPSIDEWAILVNYLGGDAVAGGKLKSTGTTYWASPNNNATNESGFNALPSGSRGASDRSGTFDYIRYYGYFLSSTAFDDVTAWHRSLGYDSGLTLSGHYSKNGGGPVRLVKD